MASGSIIDENIKNLCCLLWIFETRIAIMIMTNQHEHHDCEEDITMFDIIKIIAQLYFEPFIIVYANSPLYVADVLCLAADTCMYSLWLGNIIILIVTLQY